MAIYNFSEQCSEHEKAIKNMSEELSYLQQKNEEVKTILLQQTDV